MLLADRFLHVHDCWFDVATGRRAAVFVERAGPLSSQIAWAERCAMLTRLRHALLNPLIDFGVASRTTLFEAYEAGEALAATPRSASDLAAHLGRFLDAHGVPLTTERTAAMVKVVGRVGRAGRLRPAGLVLQHRPALDAVGDVLRARRGGGTRCVRITGPPGSGLRTAGLLAARLARVEGYMPLSPRSLARWPALLDAAAVRHVCLMVEDTMTTSERAALIRLMTRWAAGNCRPHVQLAFSRGGAEGSAVRLAPLGTGTMSTMIYIDRDYGPAPEEIFRAARESEGWPGPFLERLGAWPPAPPPREFVVHESAAGYVPATADGGTAGDGAARAPRVFRVESVLSRAAERALCLERRGRHAAAARLLGRAARVLHARGEGDQSARCWLQLAWLARARGDTRNALEHAERARQAGASTELQLKSACAAAVCWTDESRLLEAEASLRSLVAAASEAGLAAIRCQGVLALARVLYWQARSPECLATALSLDSADEAAGCEAAALQSRALVAMGDVPGGIQAARTAAASARALAHPRYRAGAARALAEALCAAGDLEGVRTHVSEGLRQCSAGHLPLAALSLRAVLLRATAAAASRSDESRRLRSALQRALRRRLPPLLRARIEAACSEPRPSLTAPAWPSRLAAGQLETFLDLAQRQKDDGEAVRGVLEAVCEQVGAAAVILVSAADARVMASAGRPWRERSRSAAQALASGRAVEVLDDEPHECAEPVRCGGELLGVVACRWIAGGVRVAGAASAVLRAAGMAIATHLRAVLDTPVQEPPAAWNDLLGESDLAHGLRVAVQRAARAPFPVLIEGASGPEPHPSFIEVCGAATVRHSYGQMERAGEDAPALLKAG